MWKNVFGLFTLKRVILTRETCHGDHLTPSGLHHFDDFVLSQCYFLVDSLTNYPFIEKPREEQLRTTPVPLSRTQMLNI